MHADIEKAYLKWRATVPDTKGVGSGRYVRTAAHREALRRAVLRRWAKWRRARKA